MVSPGADVRRRLGAKFEDAQSRLVTQASDFSLETVAGMVAGKAIDPSPHYQRRERWDRVRQSLLIESFLLNIPVPPVYLAEESFGQYSVIDGKQRITAIHNFMRGELALVGLQELKELEGARIHDLPDVMANALRVRPYIRAVTLLKQTDPQLKYEVFLRLNRGGESLTAQEVRNVAFRGALNDMLVELGAAPFLRSQFNISEDSERFRQMLDVEYVLRFFTLFEVWPEFSGDLSETMDLFMMRHANAERGELAHLEHQFQRALRMCQKIWGEYAFRRAEAGAWRGRALLGVYDAQMLAVCFAAPANLEKAVENRDSVLAATEALFDDPVFVKAATVSTNTSTRVRYRVERMMSVLSPREASE